MPFGTHTPEKVAHHPTGPAVSICIYNKRGRGDAPPELYSGSICRPVSLTWEASNPNSSRCSHLNLVSERRDVFAVQLRGPCGGQVAVRTVRDGARDLASGSRGRRLHRLLLHFPIHSVHDPHSPGEPTSLFLTFHSLPSIPIHGSHRLLALVQYTVESRYKNTARTHWSDLNNHRKHMFIKRVWKMVLHIVFIFYSVFNKRLKAWHRLVSTYFRVSKVEIFKDITLFSSLYRISRMGGGQAWGGVLFYIGEMKNFAFFQTRKLSKKV